MRGLKGQITGCLILLLLCVSPVEAKATWESEDVLPQGNNLFAVWGSSGTDVFAVRAWVHMKSGYGDTFFLYAAWGSSDTDLFAVGQQAGDLRGSILHYDGKNWSSMNYDFGYSVPNDIWGYTGSDVFVVGGLPTPLIAHYDGIAWTTMYLPDDVRGILRGVWGSSSSDVFAVGEKTIEEIDGSIVTQNIILHYDGANWSEMDNVPSLPLYGSWRISRLFGIWGSSRTDVFAVGGIETIENGSKIQEAEILHYDGTKWEPMIVNDAEGLWDVWGSSGTDVFAVGNSRDNSTGVSKGVIMHYDGEIWTETLIDNVTSFTDIWGSSGSDVFALGGGTIWHFNGKAWTEMENPTSDGLCCIWGSSASDVLAVGQSGTILHYGKCAYITQNLADAGLTPPDPTDAATVMELPAGAYTVHLTPKEKPGDGMMDVYDLETQSTATVLQGISSRAYVQPGDNILIAGFAIEGTGTKKVAIRGIGQGLRTQGVATDLDAVIEVYDATRRMIASNDDWDDNVSALPLSEAGLTPPDPTDAALILELPAGEYTVQLKPKTAPGIGLVDVYDLDPQAGTSVLKGIGSRAYVQTDDDILISGFIIRGTGTKKVAIRGIGQGLVSQDVPTDLDAVIRVLDTTPQVLETNDEWQLFY